MADSEVRQKFEVPSETPDAFEQAWKMYNSRGNAGGWEKVAFTSGFGKGFEAGMRAGEIARSEKVKEGVCQDCGRENPVWFADNDVWNAVLPDRVGFLCPICFIRRADPIIQNTGWKLIPER